MYITTKAIRPRADADINSQKHPWVEAGHVFATVPASIEKPYWTTDGELWLRADEPSPTPNYPQVWYLYLIGAVKDAEDHWAGGQNAGWIEPYVPPEPEPEPEGCLPSLVRRAVAWFKE